MHFIAHLCRCELSNLYHVAKAGSRFNNLTDAAKLTSCLITLNRVLWEANDGAFVSVLTASRKQ
jgi:hypothetical protein